MKLIERKEPDWRTVNYFGIEVVLRPHERYVAVDGDGRLHVYTSVPVLMPEVMETNWSTSGHYRHIGEVDLEGVDWRETLVHFPNEETN